VTSDVFHGFEKDSTVHDLFVEMDELKGHYWQEQARCVPTKICFTIYLDISRLFTRFPTKSAGSVQVYLF
jgi:hypothetical protein